MVLCHLASPLPNIISGTGMSLRKHLLTAWQGDLAMLFSSNRLLGEIIPIFQFKGRNSGENYSSFKTGHGLTSGFEHI